MKTPTPGIVCLRELEIRNFRPEEYVEIFAFQDWIISFEPVMTKIENLVLPTYERVIHTRRLEGSPEERSALAFLMAFQLARTKTARHQLEDVREKLTEKIESIGMKMEDIAGWEPTTEDNLKRADLTGMVDSLHDFALAIGDKDFSLHTAAPGRSFYLGDHPVCMHNARPQGFMGNIGLAVPGIEIYIPLTSDLLLSAWCPSLLGAIRRSRDEQKRAAQSSLLGLHMAGRMSAERMRQELDELRAQQKPADDLLRTILLVRLFPPTQPTWTIILISP